MKVNYYFRKSNPGVYSIENVFNRVQQEFGDLVNYNNYYAQRDIDLSLAVRMRTLRADVHHVTGAANYLIWGVDPRHSLLTVHDIGHLTRTLKGLRKYVYEKLFWTGPLAHVKYLTTISNFTHDELRKNFPLKGKHVVTIYNPISALFRFTPRMQNDRFTILQIGGGANKNIEGLLAATTGLKCHLLLVRPFSAELEARLLSNGSSFEFRSSINTEVDLARMYAQADVVYFASTYEGFGLPIIEGMAIGRPVITSNLEPMREVAAEAALFVNPHRPAEIRASIQNLMTSNDQYEHYVGLGLARSETFRADKIASQYRQLYEQIKHDG